mmetsp:Transcript_8787/g.12567  ORF Transcript_8787/g.12567 Transcript_8787/m.12567 type:complete len:142 (-) Transcript_8787:5-430(-)
MTMTVMMNAESFVMKRQDHSMTMSAGLDHLVIHQKALVIIVYPKVLIVAHPSPLATTAMMNVQAFFVEEKGSFEDMELRAKPPRYPPVSPRRRTPKKSSRRASKSPRNRSLDHNGNNFQHEEDEEDFQDIMVDLVHNPSIP